ncbi:MAG: hypothetical protein JXQ96_01600 [Cyclobacteriaceae bacterium]
MRRTHLFGTCIILGLLGCSSVSEVPQVEIENNFIKAKVYLPDPENGYYQASRFDWSGIISHLEFDNHTYFGQWFRKYDPKVHESVVGPVEEFDPLGYTEAGIGQEFLKIGVGMLKKPDESKYSFSKFYDITNPGIWSVKNESNRIEFNHELKSEKYSYDYKKSLTLTEGRPELILHHTFTNTGSEAIITEVYDHNFFVIDSTNVGPGYLIKFPFSIVSDTTRLKGFAIIKDNELEFLKQLGLGEHVHLKSIRGFGTDPEDYDFRIENRMTGAGVKITCDRPISKLAFWSATKTVCPEPYIHLSVEPGDTFTWQITYTYYTI